MLRTFQLTDPADYEPSNGADYPGGSLGRNMETIAQMVKMDLGLRVATLDFGGWDTHEDQGNNGGDYFSNQLGNLSRALAALYTDLDSASGTNYAARLKVVVMSEFGRTFKQNASRGTDHGHGNVMMVLGGDVNGGQLYGEWPGLQTDQLYDHRDLQITTDYRRVLSEVLIRSLGNPNLGYVFPGYTDYAPIGIVNDADLQPNYGEVTETPITQATRTPTTGGTIPLLPTPISSPAGTQAPPPAPAQLSQSTDTPASKSRVFIPHIANE